MHRRWVDQIDEHVSSNSVDANLATALADLRIGDRAVLLLVAWAHLSYREVADSLCISVGTVRSRLNRA